MHSFSRTELLIGEAGLAKLADANVAVFGIGGVGSYVAEALVRTGVGAITLVDDDAVHLTNLNRQLPALHSTLGQSKVEVMGRRMLDINPELKLEKLAMLYLPENADEIDLSRFDYVVDAIDTVSAKLELIKRCAKLDIPIISSMGAGNKLDPTRLRIGDIFETSVCPLAKVMRHECRKQGITALKVVYSSEEPVKRFDIDLDESGGSHRKRQTPGSISFVPATAGLFIAYAVVSDLLK
ncbi:MAG: tRNA threonylcarbamoyladenosine dehydratase [Erysipelotrichaceae bacterium]